MLQERSVPAISFHKTDGKRLHEKWGGGSQLRMIAYKFEKYGFEFDAGFFGLNL